MQGSMDRQIGPFFNRNAEIHGPFPTARILETDMNISEFADTDIKVFGIADTAKLFSLNFAEYIVLYMNN